MLISYTHKFIFFHVPKSGGISIREALKSYSQEPEKFKIKRPPKLIRGEPNPLYEVWEAALIHAKASDVKKELPANIFDKFYKFAFVRNPWDWQVSMYNFILKEKTHVKHNMVKSMSFEEYLKWVIRTKKPFPKGAEKFQKDTITDKNGRLLVDFVGRYENLNKDFQYVCDILNIKAELPHLNKSVHKNYKTYYNKTSIDMIAKHFGQDIDLFAYSFNFEPKNCKRPVAGYARHRTRSYSELLQVADNAADSATGCSRRVRLF